MGGFPVLAGSKVRLLTRRHLLLRVRARAW